VNDTITTVKNCPTQFRIKIPNHGSKRLVTNATLAEIRYPTRRYSTREW
jgi:hypothetical protein